MWDDRRGSSGGELGGVAHRDDAKDRRDETDRRPRQQTAGSTGSRLPSWAIPVGAVVAVLVVVLGSFAATRGDSGDTASDDDPPPSAEGSGGQTADQPGDEPEDRTDGALGVDTAVLPVGVATGEATVTFTTLEGDVSTVTGGLTFSVDCSAGSACSITDWKATGGLAEFSPTFFANYLDLAWTGSDGAWAQSGRAVTSCDDSPENLEAVKENVSGTLTVADGVVSVVSTQPLYDFSSPDVVCSGGGVALAAAGPLS